MLSNSTLPNFHKSAPNRLEVAEGPVDRRVLLVGMSGAATDSPGSGEQPSILKNNNIPRSFHNHVPENGGN